MERRFSYKLAERFDDLAETGATSILWSEIYRWWDRQRVTQAFWEDFIARLEERFPDSEFLIGTDESRVTIIRHDMEWLRPATERLRSV